MSIFSKIYSRINFMNKPSTSTALGATNLNKMDSAINELDNRIVTLDTTKLNLSVANSMVKDLLFDENTGKLTVVFLDGTKKPYDTSLEKIAVNFRYDKDTQNLILILEDGTKRTVDLSALVTQYEFVDSDTIGFIILENGTVSANIKDGSITENKLQPNYLADVKAETTKAESASSSAQTYSNDAVYNAQLSQSYAVGGSGIREDEDTDNAKYYYEQAKGIATGDTATSTVSFTSEDATNPTEYTNVDLLSSGETHASLFGKVSIMFKNIRYLFKMLGTTDISAIGDGSVTGGISTLNSNLNTTNTELNKKQNIKRRFILLGDSYGAGGHNTTDGVWVDGTGWTTYFKQGLGLSDTDCYISNLGGVGFIGGVTKTFKTLLEELEVSNPESITDIVVCGGYNDNGANSNNLITAINTFVTTAKTLYPNALVSIGMVGTSAQLDMNIAHNLAQKTLKAYAGVTSNKGYRYLNNVEYVLRTDFAYLSEDLYHPTDAGNSALANAIMKAVYGGFENGTFYKQTQITLTNYTSTTFKDFTIYTTGARTKIVTPSGALRVVNKPTMDSWHEVGTFPAGTIVGLNAALCQANAQGYLYLTDGTYRNLCGQVKIEGGKFYIRLLNINDNHNNFLDNSLIKDINISTVTFDLPTNNY